MKLTHIARRVACRIEPLAPAVSARLRTALERRDGEPEINELARLVDRGKMAIDIGANFGPYTGTLLALVPRVVAFEPNPALAARLCRAWPSATVEQCALGDAPGEAMLHMPTNHHGTPLTGHASIADGMTWDKEIAFTVPVRTLDSFDFRDVGFIKIDVEGHEQAVLRGARATIERERPVLLVESDARQASGCPHAVVAMLAAMGYDAVFMHDGREQPFSAWHPGLRMRHADAAPNNFIFRPRRTDRNDRGYAANAVS